MQAPDRHPRDRHAPDVRAPGSHVSDRSDPLDRSDALDPSDPLDRTAQLELLAEQMSAVARGGAQSAAGRRATAGRSSRQTPGRRAAGRSDGAEPSAAQQTAAARAICLRLLTIAPRPRAGLAKALTRKEIPDDIAASVLDHLTQVGLIDDVAYAYSFVRTKHRDRALGRSALRTELRRLGVDEESMAGAVDTVDSDAERARAEELISKRLDAAMGAGPVAARRRLLGLLGRRGYPPDTAISVVDGAIAGYSDGAGEWL